jgi:ABC-type Fe3+ transport system substrate-binding protein
MTRRASLLLALAASLLAGGGARAADEALVAAAKKEGTIVWYTTQVLDHARPLAAAFEKRYPGVKLSFSVLNAADTAVRISNEARAGRHDVDVFDGTTTVVPLKQEGIVLKWLPDTAKEYPSDRLDAEGYWIATNISVLTPGFNTGLVPPGTKLSYEALLDPKWRGQIAWGGTPSTSAGPGFVATVLAEMGDAKGMDYLRSFARQKVANLTISANAVLQQVVLGEYALGLQLFNNQVAEAKKKGAPVAWTPLEPSTVVLNVLSVLKDAPHPNAGKLLVDFLTSKEGQAVFRDIDYVPAHPAVAPLDPSLAPEGGHFRARSFTPEQATREMPRWKAVFDHLFR